MQQDWLLDFLSHSFPSCHPFLAPKASVPWYIAGKYLIAILRKVFCIFILLSSSWWWKARWGIYVCVCLWVYTLGIFFIIKDNIYIRFFCNGELRGLLLNERCWCEMTPAFLNTQQSNLNLCANYRPLWSSLWWNNHVTIGLEHYAPGPRGKPART